MLSTGDYISTWSINWNPCSTPACVHGTLPCTSTELWFTAGEIASHVSSHYYLAF